MNMGEDRYSYGTGMPMRTRASTDGATAQASWMLNERDTVRLGLEALYYQLYDWWPPVEANGEMYIAVAMCWRPIRELLPEPMPHTR